MSDANDASTADIIMWLRHCKMPYQRINLEDAYFVDKIELDNGLIEFIIHNSKQKIEFSKIKSFWYRRGRFNIIMPEIDIKNSAISAQVKHHLKQEIHDLETFFYSLLDQIPHIGGYERREMNKTKVVFHASKLGLKIPKSIITHQKDDILNYFSDTFITKGISQVFIPVIENEGYITYTELVDISKIPKTFFPSLFQENIVKEADIRVFYLCGEIYSMAIRSQENTQTNIDFRKYDGFKPNRCVPFNLPKDIEQKLTDLMKIVNLETGSIDLILDKNKDFFFLEINPVGQFSMTSMPCNYHLESKIAQLLIKFSKL